jgi:ribosomal protein L7/L12
MELSSCPDCKDLAESLRVHVKMVKEAREYATDAHAGEVRKITPLEALQELTVYYEDMMDDQDKEIKNLKFLLKGTKVRLKDAKTQVELQLKYIQNERLKC